MLTDTYEDLQFLENLESRYNIRTDSAFSSLVHFQTTTNKPFQRWYPYREGYSYELVTEFIDRYQVKGALLDPFSGSGSSLLAGKKKGIETFGIDVNPIAIFISKVETQNYSFEDIEELKENIQWFNFLLRDNMKRKTDFSLAERYFNEDILQTLLQIRDNILAISNKKVRDIFFLSWLSIIENVSYVKKEGNGLKYKNRKRLKKGYETIPLDKWDQDHFPTDKFEYIKEKIESNVSIILHDIEHYQMDNAPTPQIFHGSSTEVIPKLDTEFELTIFSPPYANFFDYFEIHKTELWLGEFISSKEELKKLKKLGLRSNSGSTVSKNNVHINKSVEHLTKLISTKKLWSNKIMEVVSGYFDDMESLLIEIYKKTINNGRVAIVVGNSAYGGIIVPSDLLIAETGEKIGFSVEEIIITRHLTTSSQQKVKLEPVISYLRESIVILKKEV